MSVDEEEMNWQKLLQRRLWRFPNSTRFFRLLLRCVHRNIMLKIYLEEHAGPQAYWHVNQGQVGRRILSAQILQKHIFAMNRCNPLQPPASDMEKPCVMTHDIHPIPSS